MPSCHDVQVSLGLNSIQYGPGMHAAFNYAWYRESAFNGNANDYVVDESRIWLTYCLPVVGGQSTASCTLLCLLQCLPSSAGHHG